jgi:hypothetical protein
MGAFSDRAFVAQVPVHGRLVFPACGQRRAQTVRILRHFCTHKMLYCAEMRRLRARSGGRAGNSLKCLLQDIEKTTFLFRGFFHKEILDSTAPAK